MAEGRSRWRNRDDALRDQGGQPARSGVGRVGVLPAGVSTSSSAASLDGRVANDRGVIATTSPTMPPRCWSRGRIQLAREEGRSTPSPPWRKRRAVNPLPEYRWAQADALRSLNRNDEAREVEAATRGAGLDDPRTFALYLVTRREDGVRAIALARQELEKRADVFTLDALAWALASAGEIAEASSLMTRALAEGTQDAPAVSPRRSNRRRRRPCTPTRSAGRARPAPSTSRCSRRSLGYPHGNRDITPNVRLEQ